MTGSTFDPSDVERLAAHLDAVDLDEKDRATLHTVFALAGQATAGQQDHEVSGFAFAACDMASPNLFGSFQWGAEAFDHDGAGRTFGILPS